MIVQPQLPVDTSETGATGTTQEEAAGGEFAALLAILGVSPEEQATSLTTAQLGLTGEVIDAGEGSTDGDDTVAVIVDSLVASMLAPAGDGTARPTEATLAEDGGASSPLTELMVVSEEGTNPTSGGTRTAPPMVSAGPLERGEPDADALVVNADATLVDTAEGAASDGAESLDAALIDGLDAGLDSAGNEAAETTLVTDTDPNAVDVADTDAAVPGSTPTDTAADGEAETGAEIAVPIPAEDGDDATSDDASAADTLVAEADALATGTTRPTGPTGRTDGGSTIPLESAGPIERGAATVATTGAATAAGATAPATPTMPTTVVEAPQPLSQVPATTMANVQQALRSGESQHRTVIRLDPPELGTITLEVTSIGDEITVIARADNVEAGRALARQRNDMAAAVEALGMSLSEFDVQTGSGSQSPDRERNAQRQQRDEPGTAENPFEQPETPDSDGDIFL